MSIRLAEEKATSDVYAKEQTQITKSVFNEEIKYDWKEKRYEDSIARVRISWGNLAS